MGRNFNGSSDDIITDAAVFPGNADFTMMAWVFPDDLTANRAILDTRVTGFEYLTNNGAGDVMSFFTDTGGQLDSSDTGLNTTSWQLILFKRDGDTARHFYNGAADGTGTITDFTNNGVYKMGATGTGGTGEFYSGIIGETAGWSVLLPTNEIAALGRGINPFAIRRESMLVYNPLYGNQDPEPDLTGNGHTGTLAGTTKTKSPPIELLENYL